MKPSSRSWLMAATLLAVGASSPPLARASGLGTPIVGSPWSNVTTPDTAAVHYNPANLARLDGFQMSLSAGLIWANIAYTREYRAAYQNEDSFVFKLPLEGEELDASKSGRAAASDTQVLLPIGGGFFAYQPTTDLTIGLGVYAPYGAALDPDDAGAQRYSVQQALIMALYATPSVAYRVNDWFQFGAGISLVIGTVNLRQVVDLAGTELLGDALADPPLNQPNDFGADAPSAVRELSVLSRPATLTTSALGLSFNLGVSFTPGEWTIGAAYQHGADLVFTGDAYLDMNHDFFTTDLAFKGLQYPPLVKGKAYIELPFPASLRLGVGWEGSDDAVTVQAHYVFWSVVDALRVTLESSDLAQPELGLGSVTKLELPRDYMDTIEVELQYGRKLTEDIRLGVRVGYHSPFSPDRTMDLSSIDGHRLLGRIMFDIKVSDVFTFAAYAGVQHVLERRVQSSRHDTGNGTYGLTMVHGGGELRFYWPDL